MVKSLYVKVAMKKLLLIAMVLLPAGLKAMSGAGMGPGVQEHIQEQLRKQADAQRRQQEELRKKQNATKK